tara:strand:- start:33 stop:683 length:651 start_codon:yes stop_codon:yes gene_type:complete
MAKIRTVEQLEDELVEETVWRKRELTTARKLVQQSSGNTQTAHLRSGVLILYAHWEGWIKATSRLYVRFVNSQRLQYDDLSTAFLGNALKTKITSMSQASTPTMHNEFASFLQEGLVKRASVSEDLVQTHSNLSSTVLMQVVNRLGLPTRSSYSTRANIIDEELVNRRNAIAHGRHLEIDEADFLRLHESVLEMLQVFTDDIRNAASRGEYLAVSN